MDANNDLEALLNSAAADFVVQHPKSAPASSTEQHASPAESSGQPNGAALTASSETAKDNDRNRFTQASPKPERFSGSQKTDETPGQQPAGATAATAPGAFDQEQMFKDIFGEELTKEFSEEFAEVLRSLSEQQSATGIPTPLKPEEEQINRTIQETMQKLAENANEAEAPLSDDELVKMLSGMGMGEGMSEEGIMPMMQQMMKQLLSKDILYPSLKDISSKYPDWLSANGGRLTPKELADYRSQHEIMCRICEEYEAEQPNDSQQVQSERFDTILSLMQKMQDYGQPPKEIVSSMAPGMELDENGLPKFPFPPGANPEQCSIM